MQGNELTLILGGARSGKSRHAETLLSANPQPWHYVATAEALDEEMTLRIAHHRAQRGDGWVTHEAPLALADLLEAMPEGQPVLVDCLTLWLSNHLLAGSDLDTQCAMLADVLARPRGVWVVVANEVGFGIVPDNALARRFRDAAGLLNQRIAAVADHVTLVVAGYPLKVK